MAAWALLPALAALIGAVAEARRHRARLDAIPHRIHVNGTRGKSSVVRLIAAGLRAGGMRVVAKTTGTAAHVILPDARELDFRGRRRASLLEYLRVAALAARERADALVVECMALRFESQRVTERVLLRASIGVLTGAGLDHQDVMGESLDDVIETLAETIPAGAVLVTAGPAVPRAWEARAAARGTALRVAVASGDAALPVGYLEWPENLALALEVCAAAGVPRDTALAGMRAVAPDPGALQVWRLPVTGSAAAVWLVAAFAANDPVSTVRVTLRVRQQFGLEGLPVIYVLNTRADRGARTLQWCEELAAGRVEAQHVVVTGPHASAAARFLLRRGWDRARVRAMQAASPRDITLEATERRGACLVIGAGNAAGCGAALARYWPTIAERVAGESVSSEGGLV